MQLRRQEVMQFHNGIFDQANKAVMEATFLWSDSLSGKLQRMPEDVCRVESNSCVPYNLKDADEASTNINNTMCLFKTTAAFRVLCTHGDYRSKYRRRRKQSYASGQTVFSISSLLSTDPNCRACIQLIPCRGLTLQIAQTSSWR